jgi:hypothetical protein
LWLFSGLYKARECHALVKQTKRTHMTVTVIMETHRGAPAGRPFFSLSGKKKKMNNLLWNGVVLGWEWSFSVWSLSIWRLVIKPLNQEIPSSFCF